MNFMSHYIYEIPTEISGNNSMDTYSINNIHCWLIKSRLIGSQKRVILVVAFTFLFQNLGRWQGHMNDILSVCEFK